MYWPEIDDLLLNVDLKNNQNHDLMINKLMLIIGGDNFINEIQNEKLRKYKI